MERSPGYNKPAALIVGRCCRARKSVAHGNNIQASDRVRGAFSSCQTRHQRSLIVDPGSMRLIPIVSRLILPSMVVMGSCGGHDLAQQSTFDRSARPDSGLVVDPLVSHRREALRRDHSRPDASRTAHVDCR
jgi:hypothetical protein